MEYWSRENFYSYTVEKNNEIYPTINYIKETEPINRDIDNPIILLNNKISELSNYFSRHGLSFFSDNLLTNFIIGFLLKITVGSLRHLKAHQQMPYLLKQRDNLKAYKDLCIAVYEFELKTDLLLMLRTHIRFMIEEDENYRIKYLKTYDVIFKELSSTLRALDLSDLIYDTQVLLAQLYLEATLGMTNNSGKKL